MNKNIKIVFIIIGIIIGLVLVDTLQSLVFNNNPVIKIK